MNSSTTLGHQFYRRSDKQIACGTPVCPAVTTRWWWKGSDSSPPQVVTRIEAPSEASETKRRKR